MVQELKQQVHSVLEAHLRQTGREECGFSGIRNRDVGLFFGSLSISFSESQESSCLTESKFEMTNNTSDPVTVNDVCTEKESTEEDTKGGGRVGGSGVSKNATIDLGIDGAHSKKKKTSRESSTTPKCLAPKTKMDKLEVCESHPVTVRIKINFPKMKIPLYSSWLWWCRAEKYVTVEKVFENFEKKDGDMLEFTLEHSFFANYIDFTPLSPQNMGQLIGAAPDNSK